MYFGWNKHSVMMMMMMMTIIKKGTGIENNNWNKCQQFGCVSAVVYVKAETNDSSKSCKLEQWQTLIVISELPGWQNSQSLKLLRKCKFWIVCTRLIHIVSSSLKVLFLTKSFCWDAKLSCLVYYIMQHSISGNI